MRFFLITLILIGYVVCFINCTGESIGRSIDPDYDAYLNNRTSEQKMKDQEDKNKAEYYSKSSNSKWETSLNMRMDSLAREQRVKDQDSVKHSQHDTLKKH